MLIVSTSYTANLASYLTVTTLEQPITNLRQLADQHEIKYGTMDDTSFYDFVEKKSTSSIHHDQYWKKMWGMVKKEENLVKSQNGGFQRVLEDSSFAFLWDKAVIDYMIQENEDCNFVRVKDEVFFKGYGIAVQQGNPIRDILSQKILELEDTGRLQTLYNSYWNLDAPSRMAKCMPKNVSPKVSFTLENFVGAFLVLFGGMLLSSIIAVYEVHTYIKQSQPPKTEKVKKARQRKQEAGLNPHLAIQKRKNNDLHIVVRNAFRSTEHEEDYCISPEKKLYNNLRASFRRLSVMYGKSGIGSMLNVMGKSKGNSQESLLSDKGKTTFANNDSICPQHYEEEYGNVDCPFGIPVAGGKSMPVAGQILTEEMEVNWGHAMDDDENVNLLGGFVKCEKGEKLLK